MSRPQRLPADHNYPRERGSDRRGVGARKRSRHGATPSLAGHVSLLAMAVSSGSTIEEGVALLAARIDGPPGSPWRTVVARLRQGADLHSALSAPAEGCSPEVRRIFRTLNRAASDGGALADQLRSLAADLHARRINNIEASAQRLSITLLFPLVLCVLPAFALLTLAPLVMGIFDGLQF